jgi:streptomycin 6-kinase
VLHDPGRGWVAIDPKGIVGDFGYDYANMLCNPLGAIPSRPGRLRAQAKLVAAASEQSLERVLSWVFAYVGLSASWYVEDGRGEEGPAIAFLRLVRDAWAMEAA